MCKFSHNHMGRVLGKPGGMASRGSGLGEPQRLRGGPMHLLEMGEPKRGKMIEMSGSRLEVKVHVGEGKRGGRV